MATPENKGLINLAKDQAMKCLPHFYAAASGKYECDLVKARLGPLLRASLTLKIESIVPKMVFSEVVRRWRQKRSEASTLLEDGDKKEDDNEEWIFVDLENSLPEGFHGTPTELFKKYVDQILAVDDKDVTEIAEEIAPDQEKSKDTLSQRMEKGPTLILSQQKDMDNFAEESEKLLKDLELKKAELKRRYYEEGVKLEKEFEAECARLMEKYSHVN